MADDWVKSYPRLNLQAFVDQLQYALAAALLHAHPGLAGLRRRAEFAKAWTGRSASRTPPGPQHEIMNDALAEGGFLRSAAGRDATMDRTEQHQDHPGIGSAPPAGRSRPRSGLRRQDALVGDRLDPARPSSGLGVFSIWPTLQTFYYSFTVVGGVRRHTWAGRRTTTRLFARRPSSLQSLPQHAILTVITLAERPAGDRRRSAAEPPSFRASRSTGPSTSSRS